MNKLYNFLRNLFSKSGRKKSILISKFNRIPVQQTKKRIYVDLDGVCADYRKLYKARIANDPEMKFPQAAYGFFTEMEEIADSVSAVKELSKHYDVWFLSAPSHRNPMCLAEKNYWVRLHFGPEWPERLILANDKSLLKGDFLIDDNATGRNQENFEGVKILFDVYNQIPPHIKATYVRCKNWIEVMEYFMADLQYQTNKKNS